MLVGIGRGGGVQGGGVQGGEVLSGKEGNEFLELKFVVYKLW